MACCIVSLFIPFCSDEAICLFWYHKDKLNFAKLYMKKKEWDFFFFFFFEREFQPMVSASNDRFLLSDQDTNQFLV